MKLMIYIFFLEEYYCLQDAGGLGMTFGYCNDRKYEDSRHGESHHLIFRDLLQCLYLRL